MSRAVGIRPLKTPLRKCGTGIRREQFEISMVCETPDFCEVRPHQAFQRFIPVRVEIDTSAWSPSPSWRAQARRPRLCLHKEKAWMPTSVGMTRRRGGRVALMAGWY